MIQTTSPPRGIVRDAAILFGRWHLAGTTFPIADIRADHQAALAPANGSYRYMDVTAEELAAVLAFPFPGIRETRVSVTQGIYTVACECGEDTYAALHDLRTEPVCCICGREWWIRVYAEPKVAS